MRYGMKSETGEDKRNKSRE